MRSFLNQRAGKLHQGAIREMFEKANAMQDVIGMGIGEPDMPTPEPICEAAVRALEAGHTHYTPNAGIRELREAIAARYEEKGLVYDPDRQIIVTNGGMGALSTLMLVVLDADDEVLIPDPQYLNHVTQAALCGGRAVRVPTDAAHNFEMQEADLRRMLTAHSKAILINSPCNPTGAVISEASLRMIAKTAAEYDLLVISDEVYDTLLYDGCAPLSIAQLPGMQARSVVINSCSKAFAMTGWRIGYAAGPAEIIRKMTQAQENLNACANAPGQFAAALAMRNPGFSEEIRAVFEERRRILLDELAIIPGLRFNRPQGAFYVFADVSAFGLSSREFCERLLDEEHVVCIPGSAFGACGEGYVRISYTRGADALREGAHRIGRFCARCAAGKTGGVTEGSAD